MESSLAVECSVCLGTFEEPWLLTRCGHSYCKRCIHEIRDGSDPRCPLCRTPFQDRETLPNYALQDVLNKRAQDLRQSNAGYPGSMQLPTANPPQALSPDTMQPGSIDPAQLSEALGAAWTALSPDARSSTELERVLQREDPWVRKILYAALLRETQSAYDRVAANITGFKEWLDTYEKLFNCEEMQSVKLRMQNLKESDLASLAREAKQISQLINGMTDSLDTSDYQSLQRIGVIVKKRVGEYRIKVKKVGDPLKTLREKLQKLLGEAHANMQKADESIRIAEGRRDWWRDLFDGFRKCDGELGPCILDMAYRGGPYILGGLVAGGIIALGGACVIALGAAVGIGSLVGLAVGVYAGSGELVAGGTVGLVGGAATGGVGYIVSFVGCAIAAVAGAAGAGIAIAAALFCAGVATREILAPLLEMLFQREIRQHQKVKEAYKCCIDKFRDMVIAAEFADHAENLNIVLETLEQQSADFVETARDANDLHTTQAPAMQSTLRDMHVNLAELHEGMTSNAVETLEVLTTISGRFSQCLGDKPRNVVVDGRAN